VLKGLKTKPNNQAKCWAKLLHMKPFANKYAEFRRFAHTSLQKGKVTKC
jgi:hypothetical protein